MKSRGFAVFAFFIFSYLTFQFFQEPVPILVTGKKICTFGGIERPVLWAHDQSEFQVLYSHQPRPADLADFTLAQTANFTFKELKTKLGVAGINSAGVFNSRNIASSNIPSRHSYGMALDISSFIMENGEVLDVKRDWNTEKNANFKAIVKVLRKHFDVVLDPDYNVDHNDHIHVDLNPRTVSGTTLGNLLAFLGFKPRFQSEFYELKDLPFPKSMIRQVQQGKLHLPNDRGICEEKN